MVGKRDLHDEAIELAGIGRLHEAALAGKGGCRRNAIGQQDLDASGDLIVGDQSRVIST
jgi:hypothetical protein